MGEGGQGGEGLILHLARFSRALRDHGVGVSLSDHARASREAWGVQAKDYESAGRRHWADNFGSVAGSGTGSIRAHAASRDSTAARESSMASARESVVVCTWRYCTSRSAMAHDRTRPGP